MEASNSITMPSTVFDELFAGKESPGDKLVYDHFAKNQDIRDFKTKDALLNALKSFLVKCFKEQNSEFKFKENTTSNLPYWIDLREIYISDEKTMFVICIRCATVLLLSKIFDFLQDLKSVSDKLIKLECFNLITLRMAQISAKLVPASLEDVRIKPVKEKLLQLLTNSFLSPTCTSLLPLKTGEESSVQEIQSVQENRRRWIARQTSQN